ncbi:MAG: hypothetical protein V7L14_10485 [Nostoc sp.]|uniref:hypothetical protein n=1 Tax=Nostoc sp. TaxID=1180 RepID=UPI002FF888A3
MAQSPSHKFGQQLGKLLENIVLYDILKPRLQQFAQVKNYYLDWQRSRAAKSKRTTATQALAVSPLFYDFKSSRHVKINGLCQFKKQFQLIPAADSKS